MRPVWLLALAALGCRGILGIDGPIHLVDAPIDETPEVCAWSPRGFDPCALTTPAPPLTLAGGPYTYDTTDSGGALTDDNSHEVVRQSTLTLSLFGGAPVAVLSVTSLTIAEGVTVVVTGRKPLLIVARETIEIGGVLDAGSRVGLTNIDAHIAQTVQFGAGANEGCGLNIGGDGRDAPTTGGSGGGGGGGFQGAGGMGARGGSTSAAGGAGGAVVPPSVIRGGCPGGASGPAGDIATAPATRASQTRGGAGGGAIRLVAQQSITVAGSISAGGAGGAGAPLRSACGGGGGGAGGYIALEAPTVTISGALGANGGGGGGGGGATDFGNEGADGKIDLQPAPGGPTSSNGCGQAGGGGAVTPQLGGADAVPPGSCGGGGGGGGAAGFVLVASPAFTATATARISPAVTTQP